MSHVFDLIKSMTKSEKRHFTVTASNNQIKIVKLFNAMNTMVKNREVYDPEKLKKKLVEKNLPKEERRLLKALLKCLRDFARINSPNIELFDLINNFKILYERGLYDAAEKNVEQAKSKAEKWGDLALLLKINSQKRLLFRERRGKAYRAEMSGLLEENKKIKEYLDEEQGYFDTYDTLMLKISNQSIIKNDTDKKELLASIDINLLDKDRTPHSNLSKLYYSICNALFNQLLGNSDLAKKYYADALNWWDDNEDYKKNNFHQYIMSLSNMIQACHFPGSYYDNVPQLLEKIEAAEPITKHEIRIQKEAIYLNKTSFLINTDPLIKGQEFQEAIKFAKEIEENIHSYNINEDFYITIYLNNAFLFFLLEDFDECIRWLKDVLPSIIETKSTARENLQRCAWRLFLICLYELQDQDKFESYFRKARVVQIKRFKLSKDSFEYKIAGLLKKLNNSIKPKRIETLNDIKLLLEAVAPEPDGLDVTAYWNNSRLTKKSIIQLMREEKLKN